MRFILPLIGGICGYAYGWPGLAWFAGIGFGGLIVYFLIDELRPTRQSLQIMKMLDDLERKA